MNYLNLTNEGTINLANGVVAKAADDFRMAIRQFRYYKWPRTKMEMERLEEAKRLGRDCVVFFRSQWCGMLTTLDGEWLLQELVKELNLTPREKTVFLE